jgi:hypothetical protein
MITIIIIREQSKRITITTFKDVIRLDCVL